MTIDKAIGILNDLLCWQEIGPYPDTKDSIKLGIKALKEVKKARYGNPALDGELLPGETKE